MKKLLLLFLLSVVCCQWSVVKAQTRIRDIYASTPDSIFPLLTKNNRLDQIDFRENNMQAVVKNKFDDHSELLVLNDKYLKHQLSKHCVVEMRLLSDSTLASSSTTLWEIATLSLAKKSA